MYSRYYKHGNLQIKSAGEVQEIFNKLGIETIPVKNGNYIIKIQGLICSPLLRYTQDIFVEWSITDHRFMFSPQVRYFSKENRNSGFVTYNGEKYNPYANKIEDILEVKENIIKSMRKQIGESYNNEILNALNSLD